MVSPGKRQNALLPEHIDKIVDTYSQRREEDRYSRVVSLEEIEREHDFNLNISRYVSTAEVEPELDLGLVHRQLADLQEQAQSAARRHNSFLEELGLPPLPFGATARTE